MMKWLIDRYGRAAVGPLVGLAPRSVDQVRTGYYRPGQKVIEKMAALSRTVAILRPGESWRFEERKS